MPSFRITEREAGQSLMRILRGNFRLREHEARALARTGKILVDRRACTDLSRRLRRGQQVAVNVAKPSSKPNRAGPRPRAHHARGKTGIVIRYLDPHVVVVDKPAGLTTVRHADEVAEFGGRAKRFLPPTLVDLLPGLLSEREKTKAGRVRAVHRLDRDTSGLVVLARTEEAERNLGQQFRAHSIERKYLAIVRGKAKSEKIESSFVRDRGDGRRGSASSKDAGGQHAVTHVRVLEDLGDFTFVECRLETGRTHQVRIHLGEQSTPLCGEKIYDRPLHGRPLPDTTGFRRPALHAAELVVAHPVTGKRVGWISPLPKDMRELLARLGSKRQA